MELFFSKKNELEKNDFSVDKSILANPEFKFWIKKLTDTGTVNVLYATNKVQKKSGSGPKMGCFMNSKPVLDDSKLNKRFGSPALRV